MGKLKNSSNATIFSHSINSFVLTICTFVYLFVQIPNANGFNTLIQLPSSGLYANSSCPAKTVVLNVNDFGAVGDGITDDTKILQDVWNVACSLSTRVKIVIPAGKFYLIRSIDFVGPCKSKVTLRVSGFIVAPQDPEVWDGLNIHRWLYFRGVKYLTVEGGGLIDGSGQKWWARSCKTNATNPCTHAPTAVTFHKCRSLRVRNITTLNSQQMHMAFTNCVGVVVSGVNVMAPADSPNTDGIHISASKNVVVKDTVVITGDDCISIVSNSSRIKIQGVACFRGHGISIGSLGKSNSYAAVQDVSVTGSFISNTENGVRIKTWQGGSGFARKIRFERIWMENVSNPIIIDQYYCDSPVPCLNQTSAVSIENVSFSGIKGTSASEEATIFQCSETYPCKKLHLENIYLESSSGGITKSVCWEAYGTTSGLVFPSPCISSGDIIIQLRAMSDSTNWNLGNYTSL